VHFGVLFSAMDTDQTPEAPFVGVTEIATRLGVHRNTVYRIFDSGQLPVVRIGARRKVRREDFDRYCEQGAA
jgi:excisionase family DNA binding protein